MKNKPSFFDFSPFDIESIEFELRNYNRRKVSLFIAEVHMLLWVRKDLKGGLLSNKKRILKNTIRKLQKIGQYIYGLHDIEPVDQRFHSDTEGKRVVEIFDLHLIKGDYINELIKTLEKLIILYQTAYGALKTKSGRSTADESRIVMEIAKLYLKHIDEPRPEGGHFKTIISLLFGEEKGQDWTKAIREARKRLKLL